jgi:BarA-like signal transduction histidine kinase
MSAETDGRVQQLCREALAAKPEDNVDRILEELRVALREHVSLAKEKLREQVNSFA